MSTGRAATDQRSEECHPEFGIAYPFALRSARTQTTGGKTSTKVRLNSRVRTQRGYECDRR